MTFQFWRVSIGSPTLWACHDRPECLILVRFNGGTVENKLRYVLAQYWKNNLTVCAGCGEYLNTELPINSYS